MREHLHVARVGRGAIEDFGAPLVAPHELRDRRVVERREPAARRPELVEDRLRQEEVPQAARARLALGVLHDRDGRPPPPRRRVGRELRVPGRLAGRDKLGDEGARLVVQRARPRREGKRQRVEGVQLAAAARPSSVSMAMP